MSDSNQEVKFPNHAAQWEIDKQVTWVKQTRAAVNALAFMWENNKTLKVISTARELSEPFPEEYEDVLENAYTFQDKIEEVSSAFWKVMDALRELEQFAKLYQSHADSITSRLGQDAWDAKKRGDYNRLTEDCE